MTSRVQLYYHGSRAHVVDIVFDPNKLNLIVAIIRRTVDPRVLFGIE